MEHVHADWEELLAEAIAEAEAESEEAEPPAVDLEGPGIERPTIEEREVDLERPDL